MLLSLSGFLFEDGYKTQSVSFEQFCDIVRSAGYQGVELRRTQVNPQTPRDQRQRLLGIAEDRGLAVTCLTARGLPDSGDQREQFFDDYLQLCADMRCGLMKIAGDAPWLHHAAEKAAAFNVTLATNNHGGGPLETVEGMRRQLAQVNHCNYGLLYDSLHLYGAGEDYLGCIDEFVSHTRNILVQSPGKTMPDDPGAQDWPAILRKFRQLGYDGLITVIENGWPVERRQFVAERCAQLLRQWWTEA